MEYIKNNLKKVLIVSIIVLIVAIGVAYYFLDYQSKLNSPVKPEFTICQFSTCVDFDTGEISNSKILNGCFDVKKMTFCGDFNVKTNK